MRFLKRENLSLLCHADTMGKIEEMVGERMNWPKVVTKLSYKYQHRNGGKVYDVGDGQKYENDLVVVNFRGHHSLYRIIS